MNSDNIIKSLSKLFEIDGLSLISNKIFLAVIMSIMVVVSAIIVRRSFNFIYRKIVNQTKTNLDNKIFATLANPVFYSILLLGILLVLAVLGISTNSIINKIILSWFWLMWSKVAINISKQVLIFLSHNMSQQKVISPQTLPLFANLAVITIAIITLYLILATWQVDMTALAASAGVAALAIGFAAKDTLSNLFAGVFILADQPYKIGDYVVLDTGERGEVTHIGIRSTRILTRDDVEVTVPNAIMGNTKIINESGGPYKKYRIKVEIGVAYGVDTKLVRQVLLKIASDNVNVCQQPEPRIRLRSFADSSLDFVVLCWVENPALRGKVLDSLNEAVYQEFMDNNIEIPYPKQDVYIKEFKGNS